MAGAAKTFALSPDYVLYDMSYANIILYTATLPSYDPDDGKYIDADDPENAHEIENLIRNSN